MIPKHLLKLLFIIPTLVFTCLFVNGQVLSESFDGLTFPPAGWLNSHTTGTQTDAVWNRATAGELGGEDTEGSGDYFYVDPHSGTGMAEFAAYDYFEGNAAALVSSSVNLSGPSSYIVSFWMHRDNGYPTHNDSVDVYINTSGSLTGATFLGTVHRLINQSPAESGSTGWYHYAFVIPSSFNSSSNYIIFNAVSDYGNNMFIDDISVEEYQTCSGAANGIATASSNEICAPAAVTFSVSGIPAQSGFIYQWQHSAPGANSFTDIPGANAATYTETVGASTDYRCRVTCSNGGASAFSNIVTVNLSGTVANDEACGAVLLVLDGAAQCGNTTCATAGLEADDPNVTCSSPNNTVWYKYTPAADGPVNILVARPAGASDYMDTWVDIFTATGNCPALNFSLFGNSCDYFAGLVTDDSVLLTTPSLTAGTEYYFRLDGYLGDYGAYCISLKSLPTAPSCTNSISPANGSMDIQSPVTFSWNAAPGATYYTLYIGTTDPPQVPADSVGDITGTSVSFVGFDPSTTYYWYVIPKNSGGSATGCQANQTYFNTAAAPANDHCDNAQNLIVSEGFCGNPVLGTLSLADSTAGLGGASCSGFALYNDVWYYVTVPSTGNVTIQTSAVNTTVKDLAIQAYSGTCGSLTPIGCDDDSNPDDSGPSQLHAKLGLTGLTPGETIYIRVMPYNNAAQGAFAICAFDTSSSVRPAVSSGISTNTCTEALPLNIDSAYKYTWATLKDIDGNIIAQVYPNGNILGNTTASFYLNGLAVRQSGNIYYLDRNITITPTTQPSDILTTRLYFKNAELNALAAVAGGAARADLNSTKTAQTCDASAAVASGGDFISQAANGGYEEDHYVDVNNSSYSTFYLHKGGNALPVNLVAFTAQRNGRANKLSWTTNQEINTSHFVIEHSTDGRHFDAIGQVATAGSASSNYTYSFVDYTPAGGMNFYRLKIVETSGNIKYSVVRSVRNEGTADVAVYPNPVKNNLLVNISSDITDKAIITVSDMNGRTVYSNQSVINRGINYITVNTTSLSSGTYVIKIQLNEDFIVQKINKL